jgi:nucleotide-binding universal stress UspA family protein
LIPEEVFYRYRFSGGNFTVFENILVCMENNGKGEAGIPVAVEIAERFHSRLFLLNVIVRPTLLYHSGKVEIGDDRLIEPSEFEEEAAGYLEQVAASLLEKGLDVECITVEGTVEESIVACIEKYSIGLVVFVHRNRGNLSRFVFGSVSDYVLKKTGIPVMLTGVNHANLHTQVLAS